MRKLAATMDLIQEIGIVTLLVALFVLIWVYVSFKIRNSKQRKLKELKKAKEKDAHGIIFGKAGKKVVYSPVQAEGSVGVFAATGAGKTSAVCIVTLRSWTGTSFSIDISGDICKNCPDMPNKLVFEPENLQTMPYNIFGMIDELTNSADKNEALEQLAFLLMPETSNMNDNARFFLVNGRKILTASLIAFYYTGMDFVRICEKIVGSSWQELFREIDNTGNIAGMMYINSFEGASEQNTAGCKQSCDDAIKLFATNTKIKQTVRRPKKSEISIEPRKIEEYNIFVIVDDPKLTLYSPLLNIVTSQMMQYISNRKISEGSSDILLCLDEFASLHIDAQTILEALRKYRKRKCRIMIMTQNLADFDILYGHAVTRAMLSNMRFKVLLGGLGETESQKYFADLIGYKNARKKSVSKNSKTYTLTESEAKEYIIEPAKLDRMGDKVVLIHPENDGYMILEKNYYYKQSHR